MSKCEHTLHPVSRHGVLTGSWGVEENGKAGRIVCKVCRKFYGYMDAGKNEQEQLRDADRKRQRRLSAQEPFLG